MGATTLGIASLGMGLLSGVSQAQQQSRQAKAQANALKQQAKVTQLQGEQQARQIENQKAKERQQFQRAQSHNRAMLGATGVDMSSGSAADIALGNATQFGNDLSQNSYNKALKEWETQTTVNNQRAQANSLQETAGNLGTSLLTAGLNVVPQAINVYNSAGGVNPFSSEALPGSDIDTGYTQPTLGIKPANPFSSPDWLSKTR